MSMARKPLIRTSQHPYHVTTRSNNKEWFYIPVDDVWGHVQVLRKTGVERFGVKIDAFVLMSNHYHMCLWTPQENIDSFMKFFNQSLGRKIARQAGRVNRVFGARYKWSLIQDDRYYWNVIRYIYQNPVRASLCQSPCEYPFSDLKQNDFPKDFLSWIDSPMSDYEAKRTGRNLKRNQIDPGDDEDT